MLTTRDAIFADAGEAAAVMPVVLPDIVRSRDIRSAVHRFAPRFYTSVSFRRTIEHQRRNKAVQLTSKFALRRTSSDDDPIITLNAPGATMNLCVPTS